MTYLAFRTALALLAVTTMAGCALAGDRSAGGCPVGEVCSTETPTGLFFLGAATSDSFGGGVGITAKAGTQTIQVLLGDKTDSPAFNRSFDATTSDAKVAAISSIDPPDVVVRGESTGTASLRLLESGTDKLLDRLSLQVEAIDQVTVFPTELFLLANDDGTTPWALLSGATVPLVVQLRAENGDRLVDEALTLTSSSGPATRLRWDLFEITAPAAGDAAFALEAGESPFATSVPVVAAIDDIVSSPSLDQLGADGKLDVTQDHLLCFVGQSAGATTVGATWTFTGTPTVTFTDEASDGMPHGSCTQIKGTAVGPAKLTVQASGFSKTFDLDFVKKMARVARSKERGAVTRELSAPSPGERAGGI